MAEPSIAMIPSGYKAEKIYSVLPTNGNADLDFARNSKATRINEQGLIEEMAVNVPLLDYSDGTCPSLKLQPQSTNLITQSEAFSNSYWTKSGASIEGDASTAGVEKVVNGDFENGSNGWGGNGWTFNQGSVSIVSANGAYNDSAIHQSTLTSGLNYEIKVTVESINGSGLFVWNSSSVGGGIHITEVGTYSFNSISSGNRINILARNGASVTITNVSVKEVQGFSAPSVDSPLGAFKLVEGTNNGSHRINLKTTITLGSVAEHTYSIFAKKGENNFIAIFDLGSSKGRWFDLNNGTIGEARANPPIYSKIEEFSNGWYKCSITVESPSSNGNMYLYTSSNGVDANVSYQGDGTSGVYIFGAQLEQQSYATSYIKTEGSTQTRLQDTASKTGISSLINSSEGTFYFEGSAFVNGLKSRVLSLSDASASNIVYFEYTATLNRINAVVRSGGVTQAILTTMILDHTVARKYAITWKLNNFYFYIDGVEMASDSTGISPTGLSKISSDYVTGTAIFEGNCKDLRVYKIALTDLELETLTSYSSFNEMALAQNYIIQ